jgi:hypothetical protein
MARSTGPLLVVGAVTIVNNVIVHGEPMDWRVPIATGLTVGVFALGEHAWPAGVAGLAWLALFTSLFVRLKPNVPSPVESMFEFWEGKK